MSTFTEKEIEYLRGQRLGLLATAGASCSPHVMPVGFRVSGKGDVTEIGGHGPGSSKKWRDLQANPRVAFVVEDLQGVSPWLARGIEMRGRADLHDEGGVERFGAGGWDAAWLTVVPRRIVGWAIGGRAFSEAGRSRARSVGGS